MSALDIVLRVVRVLNDLGIPYMLVGSFSSNFYGRSRSTNDADFVAALGSSDLARLRAGLGPEFRLEQQMSFETITMHSRHILVHAASMFRVEVFELTDDPFNQSRFNRRRKIELDGVPTWLPAVEDVIIQKLLWASKNKMRRQDIADVKAVIDVQGTAPLDLEYIRRWTDQHGTREIFEKLLGQ
jgi:hypothetical protein